MVSVDATGWEDKVRRVLAEKRLLIDELVAGKEKGDNHLYFRLDAEDRIRVGAILCRASSAEQVSSPWTAAELDDTEFFWGAYTKLDNFYALSEDWLVPEETVGGTKFRKRGASALTPIHSRSITKYRGVIERIDKCAHRIHSN